MVGNAVELYDFILYGFIAATAFGPVFFPSFESWLGTLAALSGHAIAFFVRPLGAIVFGRLGDRRGRRPALLISLSQMFPTHVRYLGVAVCIAASALIAGGLLPLPTLALVGALDGSTVPLMVMMALSGVATTTGGLLLRRLPVPARP